MQHNRAGRKLRRTTSHRRALFRNQLSSLFTLERITTTLPKAKELRPLAEKMITLGKRGGLHARRLALRTLPDKAAVARLFSEIAPRFTSRVGGYTRILKLGRRMGDGAEVAILEFIDYDFAQRQAEKKVAEKAAQEKKESLLQKAKKLVGGKGEEKPKGEAAEGAEAEKPEKPAPATEAPSKAVKAPKGPKASGPKGGGSHGGGPRKVGS